MDRGKSGKDQVETLADQASVGCASTSAIDSSDPVPDRRKFLRQSGLLAASVTPAMTVLVSLPAEAHHAFGHTANCSNFPNSPFCQSP